MIFTKLNWGSKFKDFLIKNWSMFLGDCEAALDREKVRPQKLLETINSNNFCNFKNTNKQFFLRSKMSCDSRNR